MKIGSYYYPEQWPRAQWERDLDLMVETGMQLTHVGEFAWAALEPEDGRYEFGWLDEFLGLCRERSLEVILCTPTAVVPFWLQAKRPDMMIEFSDGRRLRGGGRRHYSPTSPAMLEESDRIVSKLAEHYGYAEGVIGWQIDNELCGDSYDVLGDCFDQSEHTHEAFRHWLKAKYGDLKTLNAAWGNQFWRTERSDWSQILMPTNRRPDMGNPHASLDASRFWSQCWADFARRQVRLLRPHIGDRFTTTNFMSYHPDLDPADVAEGDDRIDVMGIDPYPVASSYGPYATEAEYRNADPAFVDGIYNHMAMQNGRWAVLEVQPGQLNWSGIPNRLGANATKALLWQAVAKGAEFITVYRWRQPLWGGEQHHTCLVEPDGVTLSPGGVAFKEVAAELKALAPENNKTYRPLMVTPDVPVVGIAHELDQQWLTMTQPQHEDWNQASLIIRWHEAAGRLGLETKMVRPDASDWQGCAVVVLPAVQMIEDGWPGKWQAYVEAGGHLIVTCRTAWKNKHGHLHEAKLAEPIHDLIAATINTYDGLPKGNHAEVTMNGQTHTWRIWAEQVTPHKDTATWATYTNGLNDGKVAVTHARAGGGTVTFCGVMDSGPLANAVMHQLAETIGLETHDLPDRTRRYRRDGWAVDIDASGIDVTIDVRKEQ